MKNQGLVYARLERGLEVALGQYKGVLGPRYYWKDALNNSNIDVEEDGKYLFKRYGRIGQFSIRYEVGCEGNCNLLVPQVHMVLRSGYYEQYIEVALNTKKVDVDDLYKVLNWRDQKHLLDWSVEKFFQNPEGFYFLLHVWGLGEIAPELTAETNKLFGLEPDYLDEDEAIHRGLMPALEELQSQVKSSKEAPEAFQHLITFMSDYQDFTI